MDDLKFMKAALQLSKRGIGFTEPNPLVGAVAVKNQEIISVGYHTRFGGPHAEQMALKNVSETGTTLYVTLEPCPHFGKTPPCCDLILGKKVNRVVAAMTDPNPCVNGKGFQQLKENGVRVEVGLMEENARHINRHYIKYITGTLPYIALHAGISIDGKLTDKYRKSQWITDSELLQCSHSIRGEFSAIMAGIKTIIEDNPQLTIREKNWEDKKLFRVILDSQNSLSLHPHFKVFQDQDRFPLILFSSTQTPNQTPNPLAKFHFFVPPHPTGGGLNLIDVLQILHQKGIASILVEGGGTLLNSFLSQDLYDEMILFTAGKLIGGESSVQLFSGGVPLARSLNLEQREILSLKNGYIIRGYRS